MAGGRVELDTQQMLHVSKQVDTSAKAMVNHAKDLQGKIDYVVAKWKGQTADAYREGMRQQSKTLQGLIEGLQKMQGDIHAGAQGFESQDTTGRQKTQAASSQFLSGPLNS